MDEARPAGPSDDLTVLRAEPLNCETRLSALADETIVPTERFYIRSHFPTPAPDAAAWRLTVGGKVAVSLSLSLPEILEMSPHTMPVTLECAGNGRSLLDPKVGGEQWGLGAVGTADWTGVPLAQILEAVGVQPAAREIVFRGADGFERSLTLDEAGNGLALLAYAMNGEPLNGLHGYPLRLIVPGWYGMASVKWLSEMELIDHPFAGEFQIDKYVFEWERGGKVVRGPVRRQLVRSVITHPADGEVVEADALAIRGVAWSGSSPIRSVEVSVDDSDWMEAVLLGEPVPYSWRLWELSAPLDSSVSVTIRARATDMNGNAQPERAEWNRAGYGNNSIQQITVQSRGSDR
ncbi:MAG TPA: sulfite oxidase [Candidatus Dormibacteraeota bacterium]